MPQNLLQHNFYPGPARLPDEVRAQLYETWQNDGFSMMEISHHSDEFQALHARVMARVRRLFSVPENYHVLALQGGGRTQFSMLAQNFLQTQAAYAKLGYWSDYALQAAKHYGSVRVYASWDGQRVCQQAVTGPFDYCVYTLNETIEGRYFADIPSLPSCPLIADMTSSLGIVPVDWQKHAMVFAASQKNLGIAGVTWVILDDSLLAKANMVEDMYAYSAHIEKSSLLYTPCTWAWYVSDCVLSWIESKGGVHSFLARNQRWASLIYQTLTRSGFYQVPVPHAYRSIINMVFSTGSAMQDSRLLAFAKTRGIMGLRGHSVQKGLRISCYIGQTEEAVDALLTCLKDFEKKYG